MGLQRKVQNLEEGWSSLKEEPKVKLYQRSGGGAVLGSFLLIFAIFFWEQVLLKTESFRSEIWLIFDWRRRLKERVVRSF